MDSTTRSRNSAPTASVPRKRALRVARRGGAPVLDSAQARLLGQQRVLTELTKADLLLGALADDALHKITEISGRELGVERVSVWRFDTPRTAIVCADLFERSPLRHSAGVRLPVDRYPAYFRALASGEPVAAADAHADPRTREFSEGYLRPLGIGAMLDAPIVLRGRMEGVLCLEHVGGPRTWTPEEQLFAVSLANLASLALEQAERRRAEEALKESEARFRGLTELSSDWYWEQDENFRFVDFSPEVEQAGGSSAASHLGKTRWELPFVDVPDEQWAAHRAVLEAHQPFRDFEYRRVNELGEIIWMSASGRPIFDGEGRFKGYRGVGRNITDRVRAEAELRRTKERLELALEASGVALWDTDLRTGEVYLSEGWAVLLGLPPAPTRTTVEGLMSLVHADDLPHAVQVSGEAIKGRRAGYAAEHRVRTPTGEWKWLLSRGKVVERDPQTGRALRMSGTNVDITERKLAEHALHESEEERFRSLTELSSDWYWEQDEELRFTFMSGDPGERLGTPVNEIIGRTRWELPTLNLTDADWARHRAQLERHEPFYDLELRRPDREARQVWVSVSGRPIFDPQGRFRGYRGVVRDISERKESEQRRAAEAVRQRDALVREVHHRIKNNLQGVAGLLQSQIARRPEVAGVLLEAIGQIQAIAKVHGLRGRGSDDILLKPLLEEIVATLQRVSSAEVRLDAGETDDRWVVPGEEAVPVALVLNELVWNAVKHRAPGSPDVNVRLAPGAGGEAVVSIENRGELPAGFTAGAGEDAAGLGLVQALLPPKGASLAIRCAAGFVHTELRLEAPAVRELAAPAQLEDGAPSA